MGRKHKNNDRNFAKNMRISKNISPANSEGDKEFKNISYLLLIAACAAASLAIGTRNGEHDT